jgi:hypothetical protein
LLLPGHVEDFSFSASSGKDPSAVESNLANSGHFEFTDVDLGSML